MFHSEAERHEYELSSPFITDWPRIDTMYVSLVYGCLPAASLGQTDCFQNPFFIFENLIFML